MWVPENELSLMVDVDLHWQARSVLNNYDLRLDRFSLLEPVQVTGVMKDARSARPLVAPAK